MSLKRVLHLLPKTCDTKSLLYGGALSVGFGLALLACGASTEDSGSGNGSDGRGGVPGFQLPGTGGLKETPTSGNGNGNGDPQSGDEKTCGFDTVPLERLPAELLLVLDRSTSMITDQLNTGETHWDVLTRAVSGVLQETQAGVHWGLKTFPTTIGCTVRDGVEHDLAANNGTAIAGTISQSRPSNQNGTPTTEAMKAATAYLQGRTTPNPKFILLATDGEPTCLNGQPTRNALDTTATLASITAAAQAGFNTFVVGIAAQRPGGRAGDTLNQMAEAGKEPRVGADTKYYSVTSEAELKAALGAIAGQVGSCIFPLSKTPPSADDVAVDIDGKRISRSNTDGWEYGPNQRSIVLNGALCDKAKAGTFKNVKITFGCPGVVIPVL
ncbi:MAG: VWA domain-containing protein [Myxococcales bacterium]|nr:VWA domain-containing protein [Myxococcales bacterium]